MQNETIDKLKEAGYITVTADSQGIADKVGIGDDFPYKWVEIPAITLTIEDESTYPDISELVAKLPKYGRNLMVLDMPVSKEKSWKTVTTDSVQNYLRYGYNAAEFRLHLLGDYPNPGKITVTYSGMPHPTGTITIPQAYIFIKE